MLDSPTCEELTRLNNRGREKKKKTAVKITEK